MMSRSWIGCASILWALTFGTLAKAAVWNEVGDAGSLPGTADVVLGIGALNQINGVVTGPPDTDMYLIRIANPATFSASGTGKLTFGPPSLLLFDASGVGVTGYMDSTNTGAAISAANVTSPGLYYLAYSAAALPFDSNFNGLWLNTPRDIERVPDGPGALNTVAMWGPTIQPFALTNYTITLTGTAYVIPGDTDGDGYVENSDLAVAISNFTGPLGGTGGKDVSAGDADGDGDVTNADLALAISNFTGPPPVPAPEPTSLALVALSGLVLTRRRR